MIVADERAAAQDHRSLGILVKMMERPAKWLDIQSIRAMHDEVRGHWGSRDAVVKGFEIFAVRRRAGVMAETDGYAALLRERIAGAVADAQG